MSLLGSPRPWDHVALKLPSDTFFETLRPCSACSTGIALINCLTLQVCCLRGSDAAGCCSQSMRPAIFGAQELRSDELAETVGLLSTFT
jgi:hypothetical protein